MPMKSHLTQKLNGRGLAKSKKHKKSDKKGNVFDPKSPASKALAIALSGAMVTAGTPLPVFAAENQSVSQPF